MKSKKVRKEFIKYFEKQGHTLVSSGSLIPDNDPTLLFTNAGMNQFKNLFLGLENRDYNRAVTSQKCVRAGGKHNDLDNVGHTARHHTFFEMLGNFSFGDYFKKEAIHYAWEFITKDLGLPKDRLYVSVFTDDDEAADIWHKQEGLPKDRISRFGEADNFWRMGSTGPCGPCSEIFFDFEPDKAGHPMEEQGDRCIEFWNLVFMQFFEDESGKKTPLPKPSVDTGMGLERLTAILQGKTNNYHTDLFQEIIEEAEDISKLKYVENLSKLKGKDLKRQTEVNVAMSVLADHSRSGAFLIGDGVLPSNEGRGYVLRRILRRAIRYGRNLSPDKSFLPEMVDEVIDTMEDFYPELKRNKKLILNTVKDEEKRFLKCLDSGTEILADELKKLESRGEKVLSGATIFKLYDTYGFPVDLTKIMANEQGYTLNESDFQTAMDESREKAKASWKGKALSSDAQHLVQLTQEVSKKHGPTEFDGYHGQVISKGLSLALSNGKKKVTSLASGDEGILILNSTCFYGESGGQAGDEGLVKSTTGQASVLDCTKQNNIHLLHIRVNEGELTEEQELHQEVSPRLRRQIAANHSATHLMHAALREVLGDHVTQAGSLVEPGRLRFDFTHNKPVTAEEVSRIEQLVNDQISSEVAVDTQVMTPDEATAAGALALFGEKYGDKVRVLKMGDFSMELCGGTHVENTAMIRVFTIVSETGVSAGVRRIEAFTGDRATTYLMKHRHENEAARREMGLPVEAVQFLNSSDLDVMVKFQSEVKSKKNLEKQLQSAQGSQVDVQTLIDGASQFSSDGKSAKLIMADIPIDDRKVLSDLSDKLRDKVKSGVIIVVGQGSSSHPIIVSVSKDLVGPINAGKILKEVATQMGGKGGGRPDFAQGAAADRSKITEAFQKAQELLGVQ